MNSKPYRIAVLANGISPHTLRWIEGLNLANRFELYLINFNPDWKPASEFHAFGVREIFNLPPSKISVKGRNYRYLYRLREVRAILKRIQPDLISTLYLTSYGFIGALLKGRTKLMHFTLGSDIMVTPDEGFLLRLVTRFALWRGDFLVSASQTMTQKLTGSLHYPEDRILTQQYGVADRVINSPRDTNSTYDFVSNRQWLPNSNIDYILEALKPLSAARVCMVGNPIPGLEVLATKIAHACKQLTRCEIFGFLPYETNLKMVAQSRYLLSLTTSDGAALSVMEAMALGTVPILSDIPPNREWVEHGHNGFLVPLKDLDEAKRCLKTAFELPADEWQKMSDRGRTIIRDRGSLTRNMGRVADKMVQLIEGHA